MSEEKLDQPNVKVPDSKDKKDKKKKEKRKNPIVRWFREWRSELKKVVWPTPKQIMKNTAVVLVIMVISSVIVWVIDQAGAYIVNTLIELGGH